MAKSTSFQNQLNLVHDLVVKPDENPERLNTLLGMLKKSDVAVESNLFLKTENPDLVAQNIRSNELLQNFSTLKPDVKENEQLVVRREAPLSILGNLENLASAKNLFSLNPLAQSSQTLGPFTANDGRLFWYDFFNYEKLVPIYLAGETKPLMLLPLKLSKIGRPVAEYTLAKGSIWIRADLFSIQASATNYTGFKITSGKLTLSKIISVLSDTLKITADIGFRLDLVLDNSFTNKGETNFGIDSRNANVKPPELLNLQYTNKKISISRMGPASWELYGDRRLFTFAGKETSYSSDLGKILISLSSDNPEFSIRDNESSFFKIEGTSKVRASVWCLSLNQLDVAKPFSIRNNGALGISTEQGLTCSWQGIDARLPVYLSRPLILAEPGLFVVHEINADFKGLKEDYKLWDRDETSGIKAGATLSFMGKKKLDYTCAEEGIEGIATVVDATIETDKPIRADGIPVAPKTLDSIYVKYVSPTLAEMMLIDQDMKTESIVASSENLISKLKFTAIKKITRPYQFALENAYLLTTPPATLILNGSFNPENILTKGKLIILYGLTDLVPMLPHPYTSEVLFQNLRKASAFSDVASFNQSLMGALTSTCDWKQDEQNIALVDVDFKLFYDQKQVVPSMIQTPVVSENSENHGIEMFASQESGSLSKLGAARGVDSKIFRSPRVFSLLDLSTNYDLLGVSMSFNQVRSISQSFAKIKQVSEQVVTIEKMNLRTPMAMLNGYTLPHISWEPVVNITEPGISDDPDKGIIGYKDQGPATVFTQFDSTVIDIDPLKYIERFQHNLKPEEQGEEIPINPLQKKPNLGSSVLFGLPNGKVSIAMLTPFNPQQATMNNRHLDFITPSFNNEKLRGGLQLRISANTALNPESFPPELFGATVQMKNSTDWNGNSIPQSILGKDVHRIFNNTFASNLGKTGVPLTHIDFSGYGASTYSNWLAPLAKFADIAQVKFDVMRGRLAHEVVQAVSMVYPYGICVVRTITFYRRNNAIVYREDSGWVAKSDGIYDFSFIGKDENDNPKNFPNPYIFHPGLVGGFFNVHNIKEVEGDSISIDYTPDGGDYFKNSADDFVHDSGSGNPQTAELVGITFDADVNMDVDGKGSYKKVTGRQFKGYLQLSPQGVPIPKSVFSELMMRNQNSIGGNVDCLLNLGGTDQKILVNRVDVSASYQNDDKGEIIFVSAARGSVQLPADGSWSVVEVDKKTGDVLPVSNKQSVPIIREGERDRLNPEFIVPISSKVSKVAFADALLNGEGSFAKRFGFVQNTGTQKLLLTDPRYNSDQITSVLSDAPLLADSFRLLNSKGPFPNLGNALKIEDIVESVTDIVTDGLKKEITNFKLPDDLTFDIIGKANDPFRMYIQYKSENKDGEKSNTLIDYVTNSKVEEKWKNEMGNMSIVVDLASFKSLMTISGDFKAGVKVSPNFGSNAENAPQLKLAEPLEKIYQILEFLDNLDPTQPVEAVKKGLKIAMSNNADSWDYKFKADKEIPFVKFPFDPINYNSPTTPLKLDASFKIGCYFNQPIKIPNTIDEVMPSAGAFLELGADLRVMCVSLAAATIYATGRAEVGLVADLKHSPTLYFKFGFGVELCVGLPVIGSVAVMYMVGVDISLNTEEVIIGAFIYFRGRAEIFGGIVTITIQIEAAGKIQKQLGGGPTSCIAMCTFALDISIFWVIDINFTETWEETRQIA